MSFIKNVNTLTNALNQIEVVFNNISSLIALHNSSSSLLSLESSRESLLQEITSFTQKYEKSTTLHRQILDANSNITEIQADISQKSETISSSLSTIKSLSSNIDGKSQDMIDKHSVITQLSQKFNDYLDFYEDLKKVNKALDNENFSYLIQRLSGSVDIIYTDEDGVVTNNAPKFMRVKGVDGEYGGVVRFRANELTSEYTYDVDGNTVVTFSTGDRAVIKKGVDGKGVDDLLVTIEEMEDALYTLGRIANQTEVSLSITSVDVQKLSKQVDKLENRANKELNDSLLQKQGYDPLLIGAI